MTSAGPPPAASPSETVALVLHLTGAQRRRYRTGLVTIALIGWVLGLVRLVVAGQATAFPGWPGLVASALALGVAAVVMGRVLPVVVADRSGIRSHWGLRRATIAWDAVDGIATRERGTGRRVVVEHGGRRSVLPVPLVGGSILGAGPDPAFDHKVDLVHRWWQDHGHH